MILDVEIIRDKNGIPDPKENVRSRYQPGKEVVDITDKVMKHFEHGNLIMNTPWREFNDMSVLERKNRDQLAFNTYLPGDGDWGESLDSWKSQALRPVERNRSLDIASQVSSQVIFPKVFAQNQNDDEDRKSAAIMRYLMEWSADQQQYEQTQLFSTLTSLYSPASIIHTEYTERMKTQENVETGETEEVMDDENSGFRSTVVPVEELYIENMYQHDIQKQGFLIWRRVISFDNAWIKYGDVDNFKFVRGGLQTVFDPMTETFYDQQDKNLTENEVEEVIYWSKNKDLKLAFVNGIIQTKVDAHNPRQDKRYPFIKSGFELMDEGKFFYYKSVVFKMQPDARNINELWRMVIDGTYLSVFPPMIITGEEEVSSDVVAPGAVTTFASSDTQVTPINVGSNLNAGFAGLQALEQSVLDTTKTPQSGPISKQQTLGEIELLQQNALTNLGLFAKMIGFGVRDWGKLMASDITQYLTIGEVMNVVGDDSRLNFRKFLLPDQTIGEKTGTVKIEFELEMPEDEEGIAEMENELMEREGGLDNDTKIFKANPTVFRSLKFIMKVNADLVARPNEAAINALAVAEYDRMIENPMFDQTEAAKLLLTSFPKTEEDPDRYIAKQPSIVQGGGSGAVEEELPV